MRGQQHSFSTHERVFLGKCQSFWDRKCRDLRGARTPNLRIHVECSNLLSYQGQTFAKYKYFLSWTYSLVKCGLFCSGPNLLMTLSEINFFTHDCWVPFYYHGLTFISAWISNYIHYNVWDKITYPFPNFNCATIEVWEWISNFIPH